jgi:hypothetical protein
VLHGECCWNGCGMVVSPPLPMFHHKHKHKHNIVLTTSKWISEEVKIKTVTKDFESTANSQELFVNRCEPF